MRLRFTLIKMSLIFIVLMTASCADENSISQKTNCMEATVIGKFASAGGGVALSLSKPAFNAEDERTVFNDPKNYSNVVQAFGLSEQHKTIGTIIYFTARAATTEDIATFPPISADGIPAKSSIIITNTDCEIK